MNIVETQDMWVLSAARRIRIRDVASVSAELYPGMMTEVEDLRLTVAGPWTFISNDLPRDGKTLFDWRICLPIERPLAYSGGFELMHLEPIIAASALHRGSLRTLFSKGYGPLVSEIERSRHVFSGESREIYHDWRGPGSSYHLIEIQFGLAR
ncbi:GyrI-like domain-containing protein [Pleomorphomonas sp. JP5]|uniref:GyrI-like domain-containing protein n=1 Tax=Pleomorphomonas sp. JP5 TaxID=2942998 RepID=UPI0020449D9A|nr:GyrI-like domain-containing protein [Pleomorphomonas sp. JP5]MCM5558696.1 GyrI-like domain-containing protein [Pleomorphomonas sp. JP5]